MKKVLAPCGSPHDWKPEASLPYEEALRAVGLEPVLIRPGDPVPEGYSGLLLMGGSDVNPSRYGAIRHPETEPADDPRDALELTLIEDALKRDIPILAICRGVQILNVQHGGTLIQHLADVARHRVRPEDKAQVAHQVRVEPSSRLAAIAGSALTLDVNSRHHQALDCLGKGLDVSGWAVEDGTVEAVERSDRRFVLGVQWHPENQIRNDARQLALFEKFAEAI